MKKFLLLAVVVVVAFVVFEAVVVVVEVFVVSSESFVFALLSQPFEVWGSSLQRLWVPEEELLRMQTKMKMKMLKSALRG